MKHEKIFPHNPDYQIKVTASIWVDGLRGEFGYNHHVTIKPKGKHKWRDVDDWEYEQLMKDGLGNIITSAKNELWEKLKP